MADLRVCAFADLVDGGAQRFDTDGHRIALVRIGDAVYAIGDRCSHAEASLSEGEVDAESCTIECPKHGAIFSLATGDPESLPATRPVPSYVARVVDGDVYVEVS